MFAARPTSRPDEPVERSFGASTVKRRLSASRRFVKPDELDHSPTGQGEATLPKRMCGRFTLTIPSAEDLASALGLETSAALLESYRPRFNIAPTDPTWVLRMKHGTRELMGASWGLVPRWSTSTEGRAKAINARAESAENAPKFSDSIARRRCAVVSDGFFEWITVDGARRPIWYTPREGGLVLMAGVYDKWTDPKTGTLLRSFSILTTRANSLVAPVHDRMPVILMPSDVATWIHVPESCEVTPDVRALLRPAPDGFLIGTRVSSRVNSVKNDDPSCVLPGDDAEPPTTKPAKKRSSSKPSTKSPPKGTTLDMFTAKASRRGAH
jgi:putative SOS response-associated peptidase YedK